MMVMGAVAVAGIGTVTGIAMEIGVAISTGSAMESGAETSRETGIDAGTSGGIGKGPEMPVETGDGVRMTIETEMVTVGMTGGADETNPASLQPGIVVPDGSLWLFGFLR
jgi:hypothetical protein